MKDGVISKNRFIMWLIAKAIAYLNEQKKIKSFCINRLINHPVVLDKIFRIHWNYNANFNTEKGLKTIDLNPSGPGSSLPEMNISSLSPTALHIYKELKGAMRQR
jgi:hypothetical protein